MTPACTQAHTPHSAKIAFALSILCTLILVGSLVFSAMCYERATTPTPSPNATDAHYDTEGFPAVDWGYWTRINNDIIGWITIPHTPINYPIVQAPANDPQFYLTHDIYQHWNYAGCPYLDADCAQAGLMASQNAIVFAHNLGWGDTTMFATIAHYTDSRFATQHQIALIQTPHEKRAYRIQGAARLPGRSALKRTEFANPHDFALWYQTCLEGCMFVNSSNTMCPTHVLTLCTCSYVRSDDERTLVYAAPAEPHEQMRSKSLAP